MTRWLRAAGSVVLFGVSNVLVVGGAMIFGGASWVACAGPTPASSDESSAEPSRAEDEAVAPLAKAHAHNDYRHERPLLDALSHGFMSVEADVFVVGEELRIAHDRDEIRAGRTLRKLYLDPLRERVKRNGGRVYKGGKLGFTLLIDFKSKGEPTYAVLRRTLADYADMLTRFDRDASTPPIPPTQDP